MKVNIKGKYQESDQTFYVWTTDGANIVGSGPDYKTARKKFFQNYNDWLKKQGSRYQLKDNTWDKRIKAYAWGVAAMGVFFLIYLYFGPLFRS